MKKRRPGRRLTRIPTLCPASARRTGHGQTSALYDTIARQVSAPHSPPPVPAPATPVPASLSTSSIENTPPHHLPAQLTGFIGREAEVATSSSADTPPTALAADPDLHISGGDGKTRLALAVGERLSSAQPAPFAHGIYAVLLAAVTDPALVLPAMATALGLKVQGNTTAPGLKAGCMIKNCCYCLITLNKWRPWPPIWLNSCWPHPG